MDISDNTDHLFATDYSNNAIVTSLEAQNNKNGKSLCDNKVNQINELPRGLKNYFTLVLSQKEKLETLVDFVNNTLMKN